MQQRIFEPLGMADSGYGDPAEGLALGYYGTYSTSTPRTFDVSALYASGGVYSTAEDLFRWNEGLYNGHVLNEAELKKMLTPYIIFNNQGYGSGYGIVLYEYAGHRGAGNGGGPDGYSSVLERYLDDHTTILIIGNQDFDPFSLSDQMGASFFGS